jgi:hypothetical protein
MLRTAPDQLGEGGERRGNVPFQNPCAGRLKETRDDGWIGNGTVRLNPRDPLRDGRGGQLQE